MYSRLFSQGGRPLCTQILPGEDRLPSTILGVRNLETINTYFVSVSNELPAIDPNLLELVTKAAVD